MSKEFPGRKSKEPRSRAVGGVAGRPKLSSQWIKAAELIADGMPLFSEHYECVSKETKISRDTIRLYRRENRPIDVGREEPIGFADLIQEFRKKADDAIRDMVPIANRSVRMERLQRNADRAERFLDSCVRDTKRELVFLSKRADGEHGVIEEWRTADGVLRSYQETLRDAAIEMGDRTTKTDITSGGEPIKIVELPAGVGLNDITGATE